MAALSANHRTIAGRLTGEVQAGFEPLPWLLLPIQTIAVVWDRNGRRTNLTVVERLIIQGAENVKSVRDRISQGSVVFAMGQGVPAQAVANDSETRGIVTLASTFQIAGKED